MNPVHKPSLDNPYEAIPPNKCMHFSKMRGGRLLLTGLLLAALVGGIVFPVSGAEARASETPSVSAETTVPVPITTTAPSTSVTTKATTSPTTKATTSTTRTTTVPTTKAPTTTAPKTTVATTTQPTTAPTTQPPATYTAPSLAPASVVVSAPTIVAGAYTVPAGTGVFLVSSVGNVPVGGDGVVQLIVDNGWQPLFGDTYVDISWDPSVVAYESAAIKVLNTTAAVSSDHSVRVMLGDFRRGYPQGRYPLAAITLRALREGTSPLTVSVDHVRYWSNDFTEFTDITATASAQGGIFSTGALPMETVPLVTFTQNTLAPSSYPTSDVSDLDTGFTTMPTTARTTEPTTVETVATQQAAALATATPPSTTQTPYAYGSYAPVSTRVQTSGVPATGALAISLAGLGVALLVRRRG